MKPYQRLSASFIGLVFGIAGLFKLMDPVGSSLIVEAYLRFFDISFLMPAAKFIAVFLSLVEVLTGIALVCGVLRRVTCWITCALLLFFTVIAVVIVVADPDMDCGCFGQAIHLTHSQTLLKNVVLDIAAVAAFVPCRNFGRPSQRKYAAFSICTALTLAFAIFSLFDLPLADYTAYRPSYTIVTEDNALVNDHGYSALSVWDSDGTDCSDIIVSDYVAVISIYDTEKLDTDRIREIASFAQDAFNVGFYPVVLSAGEIDIPGVDCYYADYKSLVSLNRSNGGATLLDDGYIMLKRPLSDMPDYDLLEYAYSNDSTEVYIKASTFRSIFLQSYALIMLAVAVLL